MHAIYTQFMVCDGRGGDLVVVVLLPLIEVALVLAAYWSVLKSTIVTIKYFSVATAVDKIDNDIVGDIEQEKEAEGDFQAAMVMQENHLMRTILDVTSIKKVKERVNSQLRLAQITWRHRVVKPGEDILIKTKALLAEAEEGIRLFFEHYDAKQLELSKRAQLATSSHDVTPAATSPGHESILDEPSRVRDLAASLPTPQLSRESSEVAHHRSKAPTPQERVARCILTASEENIKAAKDTKDLGHGPNRSLRRSSSSHREGPAGWAYRGHSVDFREQVGKIKQYHAVVRMIHNPKTLNEDDLIQAYLIEALAIFESTGSVALRCDTLNSMGTLKQNRKLFADATEYFRRAMEIRNLKLASDAAGLAQACVSLGNNLIIDQPPIEKRHERCKEALPLLEKALHHYLAAFHQKHPKVSHAHEGIAECMLKLGDLDRAQEHLDKAYAIKSHHRHGTEKLDNLARALKETRDAKRRNRRSLWRKPLSSVSLSDATCHLSARELDARSRWQYASARSLHAGSDNSWPRSKSPKKRQSWIEQAIAASRSGRKPSAVGGEDPGAETLELSAPAVLQSSSCEESK